ncbi:37486_t:CDS:2, partial [Gigaspora margarita]
AILLKDKEGSIIHSELVNIFKNFGFYTKLQANNRSEFITSVLKNTCNTFKIKLVYSYTRHPQSQEKIERFNQTLGVYEAYKKLPYKAFFGFKMHVVSNTLKNIILKNVVPKNIISEGIVPKNIAPEDIIVLENITEKLY